MGDKTEELEPLFDYSRVQPLNFVSLDEDDSSEPALLPSLKRRKISTAAVEQVEKNGKDIKVVDLDEQEEEDWLPPPPKVSTNVQNLGEDSTIKELRLKKQELKSVAQSAEDVFRAVEESAKRELSSSVKFSLESAENEEPKPPTERAKLIICFQDKQELKQFRVFADDKFEHLFKMYAEKAKLDLRSVVFCFDGDKVSPTATPDSLGMEDKDIIEVHVKSS